MPKRINHSECTLFFCSDKHYGRGLCPRHYQNWLRNGDPLPSNSEDLRSVLIKVIELHDAVERLIEPDVVFHKVEVNGRLVATRCNHCGFVKEGGDPFEAEDHGDGCVMASIDTLMDETINRPPEGEFTYAIDLNKKRKLETEE